jgi:hypothetical protein
MDPSQRWPTVFPVPIVALLGLVLARRPRQFLVLIALLQLALPQGVLAVVRGGGLGDLGFSYIRLIEEGSHDAGLVSGLVGEVVGRSSQPPR